MLIRHIENNECRIIAQEDFERQRAEKQIIKDAFAAQLDPYGGAYLPLETTVAEPEAGKTLLDDDNAYQPQSWQDVPLQPLRDNTYRAPKPPIEGVSRMALNNFPVI